MPSTITGTATFSASIPTPDDTEGATGAGLDGMTQPLINNDVYLKAALDAGVKRIQLAANPAALTALSPSSTDLDIACIPSVGLYVWVAAATTTVDGIMVIGGVGAPPAAGRWLLQAAGWEIVGGYGGTPRVAGIVGGKISGTYIPNTLVQILQAGLGTLNTVYTSTSSLSYTATGTVAGLNVTGALVGDILVADVSYGIRATAGGPSFVNARVAVVDGVSGTPATTGYNESAVYVDSTTTQWIQRSVTHVVTAAGTSNVRIQILGNGANAELVGPVSIAVKHHRV